MEIVREAFEPDSNFHGGGGRLLLRRSAEIQRSGAELEGSGLIKD